MQTTCTNRGYIISLYRLINRDNAHLLGYDIIIASPLGGPIPIDKGSMAEGFFTDDAKKFMVSVSCVYIICIAFYVSILYALQCTEKIYILFTQNAYIIHRMNTAR